MVSTGIDEYIVLLNILIVESVLFGEDLRLSIKYKWIIFLIHIGKVSYDS